MSKLRLSVLLGSFALIVPALAFAGHAAECCPSLACCLAHLGCC